MNLPRTKSQQRDCGSLTCSIANGKICHPAVIVIFGASGDLTARKLIPALFNLFRHRCLPPKFNIVGCGRRTMNHSGFRRSLAAFVQERQLTLGSAN